MGSFPLFLFSNLFSCLTYHVCLHCHHVDHKQSRMMVTTICLSQADGDRSTSTSAGSSCDTPSGDEEVSTIRIFAICVEDNVEDKDGNDGERWGGNDEESGYYPVDGTGEPQPADALEVLHISSGDYHNS